MALSDEIRVKKKTNIGAVEFRGTRLGIGRAHAEEMVAAMDSGPSVMIFDLKDTLLIEPPWPDAGVKHVSNGRPLGPIRRCL
ncbi:hypothetical protein [Gryllotalpicola protaetiae]|uniref:hypothetical protein n=1 Tax=Gryllotalpicola protaetiae TaxID=2419771 RepID=UPI0013C47780|nr:hypothetical protein [Gryllotalpicola protaetiae]